MRANMLQEKRFLKSVMNTFEFCNWRFGKNASSCKVTHHLETEGWNKARKSRIYSTFCCQVLAVNCHEAWRLFEQHSATYLRTTQTNRCEVHYEIQVDHKSGNAFCYSDVLSSASQSGYENKKNTALCSYGCKTRSLILLRTLKYLTRATEIPDASSPGQLNLYGGA